MIRLIMTFVLIGCACSCRDNTDIPPDYLHTGEEVSLAVGVTLPVMDSKTRASLDDGSLNMLESLWIRTYSAVSGEATGDWMKIPVTDNTVPEEIVLTTQSGLSYIVAVANVNNRAVTRSAPDTERKLSELLEEADTWERFLDIAVATPSGQEDVRAPRPPLPMAGCYSDLVTGGSNPEPARTDEWQDRNFQPYFIPVSKNTVKFEGAIHLRRLVSHLNFNIIPGNDNLSITVNSYQVKNAPKYTWLHERPEADGMSANFGDTVAATEEEAAGYYIDVPRFGSQNITTDSKGVSHFDFWQGENKRTGTASTFTDRDKVSENNPVLFTSLTGDSWNHANEASYVIISCSVDYRNSINVGSEGEEQTDGGTPVLRSGEVTYLIHLGYTGSAPDADKAKDFNCHRNVDYTYNLTVNGLNDIRLDAYATDETFHGEEGIVVDLLNSTIVLDAHYNVFNIELKDDELKDANFGFIINTYENGNQYTITSDNPQRDINGRTVIYADTEMTRVIDAKYYNWIELRPTTGENVLAEYKPRYGPNSDGKTFLLTDLKGGYEAMLPTVKSPTGWYTVYINEYTYEPMYTGSDGYGNEENTDGVYPNWMGYVNENPRRFYIRLTQKTSPDGKSIYARSKYSVSQQSIMTYYSDRIITTDRTAIGSERRNENEGMNLRYTYYGGNRNTVNGRWNTAQYVSHVSSDGALGSGAEANRPRWNSFIIPGSYMEVGGVQGERAQGGPALPERTIASGKPVTLSSPVIMTNLPDSLQPTLNDPQNNNLYTIEAINACMNRNRDNNGNGRIEPEELRWYVPSLDQYLQLECGKNSLPESLMQYSGIPALPRIHKSAVVNNHITYSWSTDGTGEVDNKFYSRYMFVGSNSGVSVLWGMEGTSSSTYPIISTWAKTAIRPWQVRCIRNLGVDLTKLTDQYQVTTAYVHDAATRTIRMTHYDIASVRVNRYQGNGTKAHQMPIHTINSPYNSVFYGFEYAPKDLVIPTNNLPDRRPAASFNSTLYRLTDYIADDPCAKAGFDGRGWRLPNQIELSLMRHNGIFQGRPAAIWLSCTVNYFSYATGLGTNDTLDKYFLIAMPNQGSQLTQSNFSSCYLQNQPQIYIRCVRDTD